MRKYLVGFIALALVLAACGDGDGDANTPGSGDGQFSVLAALGEIPAGIGRQVEAGDISAAIELAGVERTDGLDGDSVVAWLGPITGQPRDGVPPPVFVPVAAELGFNYVARTEEFHEELGWSLVDVDWFVSGGQPPHRFTVVAGDFGAEALADLPEVAAGVVSAGEGDDHSSDLAGRTAARPLGVPLRLARIDDRIALSAVTPLVQGWLGGDPTLADDAELADVARALDAAGVVGAFLYGNDDAAPAQANAVGMGWGVDGDRPIVTVAYRFAEAGAIDDVRSAWDAVNTNDQRLSVTDVVADGSMVVVTVEIIEGPPSRILAMFMSRELPSFG